MLAHGRLASCFMLAALAAFSIPALGQQERDIVVIPRDDIARLAGTRIAVVVGLDEYSHPAGLPQLTYAAKDARDLERELARAGWFVSAIRMDAKIKPWSSQTILSEVKRVAEQANSNDTLLFYFSGHGFADADGRNYLCAYNTVPELDQLRDTALAIADVRTTLEASEAKKRLLWIDACRNDPTSKSPIAGGFSAVELHASEGTGLLFGTGPGTTAREPQPGEKDPSGIVIENGLFTHFVLQGLGGKAEVAPDRFITFLELSSYVGHSMQELALKDNRYRQKPFTAWTGGSADDVMLRDLGPAPLAPPPVVPADKPPVIPRPTGEVSLSMISLKAVGKDSNSGMKKWNQYFGGWLQQVHLAPPLNMDRNSLSPVIANRYEIRYESGDPRGKKAAQLIYDYVTGKKQAETGIEVPRHFRSFAKKPPAIVPVASFAAGLSQDTPDGYVRILFCSGLK